LSEESFGIQVRVTLLDEKTVWNIALELAQHLNLPLEGEILVHEEDESRD